MRFNRSNYFFPIPSSNNKVIYIVQHLAEKIPTFSNVTSNFEDI